MLVVVSMISSDHSLLWNVGSIIVDAAIASDKVYQALYDFLKSHEFDIRDNVIWKIEDFGILLMEKGF